MKSQMIRTQAMLEYDERHTLKGSKKDGKSEKKGDCHWLKFTLFDLGAGPKKQKCPKSNKTEKVP